MEQLIRPASNQDVEAIVALLKRCNLFNPTLDYGEWSHPTLVYVWEGQIIGMVQALLGQPYAYVSEIAVDPQYQNKGIGSQLLRAVEETLKVCGITHYGGIIMTNNETTQAKYEHLGGQRLGTGVAYMKDIR